jgi:hypothetical protein
MIPTLDSVAWINGAMQRAHLGRAWVPPPLVLDLDARSDLAAVMAECVLGHEQEATTEASFAFHPVATVAADELVDRAHGHLPPEKSPLVTAQSP